MKLTYAASSPWCSDATTSSTHAERTRRSSGPSWNAAMLTMMRFARWAYAVASAGTGHGATKHAKQRDPQCCVAQLQSLDEHAGLVATDRLDEHRLRHGGR
jgi:hypothetical protein